MNSESKLVTLGELFTEEELRRVALRIKRFGLTDFHRWCREEITEPALERINGALGQENDASYLAYMLEFASIASMANVMAKKQPETDRKSDSAA